MYPDDKRLYPLYERCAALEVPVLIKLSHQMGPDLDYSHPRYLGHVADAFPQLDIVAVHGCWPFVREAVAIAHRYKNVHLEPDFYIHFPGGEDYVQAANLFLADRLLYCSSYPLAPVDGALARFRQLPFQASVLPKVLGENAARLFRL